MVMVVGDGSDGHRLERPDGTLVGSIRNGAVRLGWFASDAELVEAALALWPVLDATLHRQYPGWRKHTPDRDALRLVHDGAHEWVSDGQRPLARVVRPAPRAGDRATRLEFVLPTYASEGVLVSTAAALALALDRFTSDRETASRVDHGADDGLAAAAPA